MSQAAPETRQEQLDEAGAKALAKEMAKELSDTRGRITLYDDYYNGLQVLPVEPKRLTQAYKEILDMSVSNWSRLVIDVVAERLRVGKFTSSANAEADTDAWAIWQANNLDAYQSRIHVEALKMGVCYASVWPNPTDTTKPVIRGESPLQVHVRTDEQTGLGKYAVKVWQGRDNYLYVTLYDSTSVYRFKSAQKGDEPEAYAPRLTLSTDISQLEIAPRADDDDGGWLLPNPVGQVPFVPFYTQPDLLGGYASEIAGVVDIQDRINRTTFHRLLTQEFHAFPQRWVTGIDVDVDEDGNPVDPFPSQVDRLWTAVSGETRFGQFPASDPKGFLEAINADIQALATQSRTPPHYLMGGMGQFPSAESVRATEYGLHRKVEDRQQSYGEAWEEVMRLSAKIAGNTTLAEDVNLATGWDQVEARTEGELVDALLKMATLGVPQTVIWEKWGATPDEIKRWGEAAQAEMEARAGLMAPGEGMAMGNSGPPEARVGKPEPPETA